MAYAPLDFASRENTFTQTSQRQIAQTQAPKRGVFRRFYDALIASRQRQADHEIARFLQNRGGRLTDDAEREIERRFLQRPFGKL
jgi:hypothetical protein